MLQKIGYENNHGTKNLYDTFFITGGMVSVFIPSAEK